MTGVLIGAAFCVLVWSAIWKRNLVMGFGVLLGVLLAWILSYALEPYVTGMNAIPVWLPPLPLATVATVLFVYGALVWFRGNDRLPKPDADDHDEHDKHH